MAMNSCLTKELTCSIADHNLIMRFTTYM